MNKSIRIRAFIRYLAVAACFVGGPASFCRAADAVAEDQGAMRKRVLVEFCQQLAAPDDRVRKEAAMQSGEMRGLLVNALLANLQSSLSKPEGPSAKFNGPFHIALMSLNQWRVEEAADLLAGQLTFKLDPASFPTGLRLTGSSYYPVALTLSQIGGPRVTDAIFHQLTLMATEEKIRVCAWILDRSLGAEIAKPMVQAKLDRSKAILQGAGGVVTNAQLKNLQSILALLETAPVTLNIPTATALQK